MARVVVVSRNAAMALGLSGTEHDVLEMRPTTFGEWIESDEDCDALVLDLESPVLAAAGVAKLRDNGKSAPVLLVSSDSPGWDSPDLQALDAAVVLPLPVTKPALVTALDGMLQPPETAGPYLAGPEKEAVRPHEDTAAVLDELRADQGGPIAEPAAGEDHLQRLLETAPGLEPAAATADEPAIAEASTLTAVPRTQRRTTVPRLAVGRVLEDIDRLRSTSGNTSPAEVTAPATPRRSHAKPKQTRRRMPDPSPRSVGAAPASTPAESTSATSAIGLVRALGGQLEHLYGVPETAEVIVTDAVDRAQADAGAVLVPDDGVWRVAAGVGLRPLEHRYELQDDSWLIEQIARAHKGAIVQESDVAREQLHGAPLASWRHLLAAPVPGAEGLLIVARRDDPPFTEENLSALAAVGREAQELLQAALDTRSLARALSQFRDEVDLPR